MSVIDELLAHVPQSHRIQLEHIRKLVHRECPDAEEVITYGMPGFKYRGKYLLSFANFKDHMSLFPGAEPIEVFAHELAGYKTSKGTIQFTLEHKLSDGLLVNIILLCKERIERSAKVA